MKVFFQTSYSTAILCMLYCWFIAREFAIRIFMQVFRNENLITDTLAKANFCLVYANFRKSNCIFDRKCNVIHKKIRVFS